MQDRLESILIDIYYNSVHGAWTQLNLSAKENKAIEDYVIKKPMKDPIGQQQFYYMISSAGRVVVEFVLRKYSRETSENFGGLALEKRDWLMPQRHDIPSDKIVDAFKEIAERGKIPVKVYKDWIPGRKRVVFTDLDRGLARISAECQWEMNKNYGAAYLRYEHNFSDIASWLLSEVLDPNRKVIRSCHFQQEFVLWDR